MIITKLELENFMCYSGYNCFEFKEGLNIIIGDNGYGKSKLFDAFYWVLYDQCYDTNKKKFVLTTLLKSSIVSDKAKFECEEDKKVIASARITFHNVEKDTLYILERKYTITKLNDGWREGQFSDLIIWRKEASYLNSHLITSEEEKERIKKIILPDNIQPYMWFQGEQVESIIDFNKHDTLTQAINVLSDITKFDTIKDIATAAFKTAKNEYTREAKRLSADINKSEELERKRKQAEEILQHLLIEESQIKENLSVAEEKFESLLNKLKDAQRIKKLEEKKHLIKKQLEEQKQRQLEEQANFHKKLFKNKWLLKGTASFYRTFGEMFSIYEQNKMQREADFKAKRNAEKQILQGLKTRLPIDVPEPIYIQQMLKEERCLVCDREAKKDTEPWNKIKELIDRNMEKLKDENDEPLNRHNFHLEFKKLYQNGLGLSHTIENIDENINETLTSIQHINRKVKELIKELEKLENEVQRALNDASLNLDEADNILNEIAINDKNRNNYREDLVAIKHSILASKEKIIDADNQLKGLIKGELPKRLTEKVNILEDLEIISCSTRDRVFNELITRLENEANIHYSSMTKGNKSVRGIIKLEKLPNGNYMPQLINNDGTPLLQLNTGNIILIKLATIMAIISARQGSRSTDLYSLITDAPMSVFGEDYTIGFCKTVSRVYRQSIIMSKEFYKNQKLRDDLLNNEEIKLGKVYVISPSIEETDRSDRNKLATLKTELL